MVSVVHVFSCVFVQQFVGSPRPVRAIAGLLLPLTRSTEPFFFRVYVRAPRADLLLWSTLVWCGFYLHAFLLLCVFAGLGARAVPAAGGGDEACRRRPGEDGVRGIASPRSGGNDASQHDGLLFSR